MFVPMGIVKTSDVFVSGRDPRFTYNPRDDRELEKRVRDYLEEGGTILTIVGPTKTGKTVLLHRVLTDPIWIESQGMEDADAFWKAVGSAIDLYVIESTSEDEGTAVAANAKVGIKVIEIGGQMTTTSSSGTVRTPIHALGADARKALQSTDRVLVVDDFHFIHRDVQKEIIRAIKPLLFEGVRVIFASISHRKNDVPAAVEDMMGRTELLEISLWTVDELVVIARNGFEALNVTDDGDVLARVLAENSFGSPHLMQKLCRILVKKSNAITETVEGDPVALVAPDDWNEFFAAQIEGYAGQWHDRFWGGPLLRGKSRILYELPSGHSVDGYAIIMLALANSIDDLRIPRGTLNERIENIMGGGQTPEGEQVTRFLKQMTEMAKRKLSEDVLPEEALEAEEGVAYTYAGPEPILEYVEDGSVSILSIADPFFAYYLRWAPPKLSPS